VSWCRLESCSFRKHRGDVALDSLGGDRKFAGDVAVGVAARDESKHLSFTRREQIEVGIDVAGLEVSFPRGRRRRGRSRRDAVKRRRLPPPRGRSRPADSGPGDVFGDVAAGAGANDALITSSDASETERARNRTVGCGTRSRRVRRPGHPRRACGHRARRRRACVRESSQLPPRPRPPRR
jgi:hypothetical protein